MRKRLVSAALLVSFILPMAAFGVPVSAQTPKHDVLRSIFSGIDEIAPDDKALDLPYEDGRVLSDVREPLYIADRESKILGESSFSSDDVSWKDKNIFKLKAGSVTINGASFSIGEDVKLLAAAEGDFTNSGRKSELAVLAAAKTTDDRTLLLLCTVSAAEGDGTLSPVVVLYSGTSAFYDDVYKFVNCMEVVCADINGDGYDEIATATPTGGYAASSSDEYKLDNFGGAYIWSLAAEGRDADGWKSARGWQQTPSSLYTGLNSSYGDNCHLGAPGTTAALAAADVDGDGYDDLVTAFSTTKAQYNAKYSSNHFSVYYIGGAPTIDEMIQKRSALMRYVGGEAKEALYLGTASGDAAGFDVAISDVDGSGKPTIFLSFKQTVHYWAAMSDPYMYTPCYYIYSFDMKGDGIDFTASPVYKGGIYHHGWMGTGSAKDPAGYVYRTDYQDCAPVRIGVLRADYGLSEGKTGYASAFSVIADQRILSFVRRPDGNAYSYDESANNGRYVKSVTETNYHDYDDDKDNGQGFKNNECVLYKNGLYITDIKTANISFDGETYRDAALVTAYDNMYYYKMYYVFPDGSGYSVQDMTGDIPFDTKIGKSARYCVAAMPDTDNDSISLRYNKHVFFWADPVIIAALASPPYFESLPSDMYTNSQTTYGKSLTTSTGKTESYTVSAGSYVSTEIKGGGGGLSAVFEAEAEAMSSTSSETEESYEVSYTQSFSAGGGSDTVVLSTVAYDAYAYTAYYPGPDGEAAQSPYIVYIPRGGAGSIKIASINYEDYLSFSKYAEGAMPELDDVFTHEVGKPASYPKTEPAGANVVAGSVLVHKNIAGFPSDTSSQTRSVEITSETSATTSSGTSLSAKLGGGIEAEAEDVFGMINYGAQVIAGSSSEKEYESGRISTKAVGTSFEGTVFGQGDGMNTDGGTERAAFSWKLMHYIYNFKEGKTVKQFPVVTYLVSDVNEPKGVVPDKLFISPAKRTVEQVGPKTAGYVNEVGFTAEIEGVTRESYTALEGAPLGMTLNTGDGNIGTSGKYPFGIKINSNVKPGEYELCLNVGGVRSNTFTVVVEEYTDPIWIEADKTEIDFGENRYNYAKGTPSAEAQTVTIKNIHNETIADIAAELDENSDFEITEALSRTSLNAAGLASSDATVKIAPKRGLGEGVHTGILKLSNGITSAFVSLKYTVTQPTLPGAPILSGESVVEPAPVSLYIQAPKDDGGGKMLRYLYTIKGHKNYVEEGTQVWKPWYDTSQSGYSFHLRISDELTVGEVYTVGVKAVTAVGESEAAWIDVEISQPLNEPAQVTGVKAYPSDGKVVVTWNPISYWGENKYYPEIPGFKYYQVYWKRVGGDGYLEWGDDKEFEWSCDGLENGVEYEVAIQTNNSSLATLSEYVKFTPSADVITTPSRPKTFKAAMSYKTAALSWAEPGYIGSGISGYRISKDGGASWIDLPADTFGYTFEGLTTNQTYDFCVRAVSAEGAGDNAVLTEVAPSSLDGPVIVDVTRGYEQLELEWEPLDDESVTGYEVKLDDGQWERTEPIEFGGTLRHIFSGLENGRKYTAYVRAVNDEGPGKENKRIDQIPTAYAPLPPTDVRVEPRNGAIDIYAVNKNEGRMTKYMLDGGTMWWSFWEHTKVTGLENGREYIVAVSTAGIDGRNDEVRTTVYLTVTPDASIPDEPSAPDIEAFVSDEYIRFEWSVENDGGAPIERYEVSVGDGDSIQLPATETSFEVRRSDFDEMESPYFYVTAYNSAGSAENGIYVSIRMNFEGLNKITLPSVRSEDYSTEYRLTGTYVTEDDDGNPVLMEYDASDSAEWSLESDNGQISWDEENRRLVIDKNLADGSYKVMLTARHRYTFEKEITIEVGGAAKILSAQKTPDGISVKLDMPAGIGTKTLCAALYDSSNRFMGLKLCDVSASMLADGEIGVDIDTSGAKTAKVMLFDSIETIHPLCESVTVTLLG